MEINIKINNEEDILLRIDIEKVDENDGSVTFRLFSIVDGEIILKLRLKDDELIILEKKD
ncbi:hypothetical protein HX13_19525 [Chryseobacterium sp. P1-3]|uniref:hypothetical protein n=1 Tax=Chryseobacterium sp. (strain P1-3) TaxID=1517683 RepID=UPI0004E6CB93|nr:hypothetical protein [Chryseobacterium sp. P1-3]KFF73618.1 hypothetical protein HX13_19525 [Chryseobacterium sp. P1-3]